MSQEQDFIIKGAAMYSYNGSDPTVKVPKGVVFVYGIYDGLRKHCDFIERIELPRGVTDIYPTAFENCRGLRSISLPKGLKRIGGGAFENCQSLMRITIPQGIDVIRSRTFFGCKSLSRVTIPKGVKRIESYAFRDCSNLVSIDIPEGVTEIQPNTFQGCSRLRTVKLPSTLKRIRSEAFEGCTCLKELTIPAGVEDIDKTAFKNTGIRELKHEGFFVINRTLIEYDGDDVDVYVPAGIERIGTRAFEKRRILSLSLPDSVVSLDEGAFYNCQELESITLPKGLKKIESYAFKDCINLVDIDLPEGVREIGYEAFCRCESLKHITLPSGLETYNDGILFGCKALEGVDIPEGITCIKENTFMGCESLKEVSLPNTIEKIEKCAFSGCRSLVSFTVPDSVREIGAGAFSECKSLCEFKFGAGSRLDYIGKRAFYACSALEAIHLPTSLRCLDGGIFERSGVKNITLSVVPRGKAIFSGCRLPNSVSVTESILDTPIKELEEAFSFDEETNDIYILKLAMSALIEYKPSRVNGRALIAHIRENPDIYSILALSYLGAAEVEKYISVLKHVSPKMLDYFVGIANEHDNTDAASFILEYKRTHYTAQELAEYESDALDKSLGIKEMTVEDYEEMFKLRFEGKHVKIVKYIGTEQIVELPCDIGGYTLTDIGKAAFKNCKHLKYIGVSKTVKKIGDEAFKGCTSLSKLNLPIGVNVGEEVFVGCDGLGDEDGFFIVRGTLYHYCGTGAIASIPKSVEHIHPYAFHTCEALNILSVPSTVHVIAARAIFNTRLDAVYIGEGVKIITWLSFGGSLPRSIHAPRGSSAESFAKENRIKFLATD